MEAKDAVSEYPQFKYAPVIIRRRKAFGTAAGSGLCVLEFKSSDVKTIEEMKALAAFLF